MEIRRCVSVRVYSKQFALQSGGSDGGGSAHRLLQRAISMERTSSPNDGDGDDGNDARSQRQQEQQPDTKTHLQAREAGAFPALSLPLSPQTPTCDSRSASHSHCALSTHKQSVK